jgi:hypothetical protein
LFVDLAGLTCCCEAFFSVRLVSFMVAQTTQASTSGRCFVVLRNSSRYEPSVMVMLQLKSLPMRSPLKEHAEVFDRNSIQSKAPTQFAVAEHLPKNPAHIRPRWWSRAIQHHPS